MLTDQSFQRNNPKHPLPPVPPENATVQVHYLANMPSAPLPLRTSHDIGFVTILWAVSSGRQLVTCRQRPPYTLTLLLASPVPTHLLCPPPPASDLHLLHYCTHQPSHSSFFPVRHLLFRLSSSPRTIPISDFPTFSVRTTTTSTSRASTIRSRLSHTDISVRSMSARPAWLLQ